MIENLENLESENGIDDLLLRCLDGRADEAEYDRAWQWVSQSDENRTYYRNMFNVLVAYDLIKPVDSKLQKRVWTRLERNIQKSARKSNRYMSVWKWAAAAAILVIAYMAGIHLYYNHNNHEYSIEQLHTIHAAKGEKPMVEMSDGSKVWLNDETSFMYSESFGKDSREVSLLGEAYFEVAKNAGKPFILNADELRIEVLGTQFNVKIDQSEITTTLIEGSVKIQKNDPEKETGVVILVPGQQLQFDKQSGKMALYEVNSRLYTAWKDGKLVFDRDPMKEVFALIEQNFGVTVILENEKLADRRFTGRFGLDEKPEKIFSLIQQSIKFGFHIQNDTIYVR